MAAKFYGSHGGPYAASRASSSRDLVRRRPSPGLSLRLVRRRAFARAPRPGLAWLPEPRVAVARAGPHARAVAKELALTSEHRAPAGWNAGSPAASGYS